HGAALRAEIVCLYAGSRQSLYRSHHGGGVAAGRRGGNGDGLCLVQPAGRRGVCPLVDGPVLPPARTFRLVRGVGGRGHVKLCPLRRRSGGERAALNEAALCPRNGRERLCYALSSRTYRLSGW